MTRAIRIHETGGPEALRWEKVEVGEQGDGQLRLTQSAVGAADIDIQLDAGANNLFERNTFFINSGSYSGGISVAAPTDFGGGPAGSAGGNRFGAVRLWEPEIWTLPRGGVINADNNLWPPGGPGSVAIAGSGTVLTTNNARTDSLTPDDGLRLWILSYRARIGP